MQYAFLIGTMYLLVKQSIRRLIDTNYERINLKFFIDYLWEVQVRT